MSTEIKIHELEQRSPQWHAIRVGRVGGSESIGLTTAARMKTMIFAKAAEHITGKVVEIKPNTAMQLGIDLEPFAKEAYEESEMVSVDEVGYITNVFYKYAGLSPDGLVGKKGALEIKVINGRDYLKFIVESEIPKTYLPQVVHYFMILESLEWLDFMVYNPDFEAKPFHIVRVTREDLEKEIEAAKKNYLKFEIEMDKVLYIFTTVSRSTNNLFYKTYG